jgi:copper(I)-binding protein
VNRALRAATTGVLLLSPIALTACSSGQVTQTATQERDKTGGQASVGAITLRAVKLEHPRGGVYEAGDDADLRMAIVNSGTVSDTLTGVDGEGFASAEITGARDEDAAAGTSAPDEIEIPADDTVFVGEDRVTVELTGLDDDLTTGQYLELVLTFENAGEVTVNAPVANPDDEQERGEIFDFHEGSGAHSEGGEEGEG